MFLGPTELAVPAPELQDTSETLSVSYVSHTDYAEYNIYWQAWFWSSEMQIGSLPGPQGKLR